MGGVAVLVALAYDLAGSCAGTAPFSDEDVLSAALTFELALADTWFCELEEIALVMSGLKSTRAELLACRVRYGRFFCGLSVDGRGGGDGDVESRRPRYWY